MIEVGSRAVRLLVADIVGEIVEVAGGTQLTDLASAISEGGASCRTAISNVNFAVRDFVEKAERFGATQTLVFGTEAVRALQLVNQKLPFDFDLEVLSGELESRCSFIAAVKGLSTQPPAHTIVIDLGAGSLELALGEWVGEGVRIDRQLSLPLGTVHLGSEFRRSNRDVKTTYKWIDGQVHGASISRDFGSANFAVCMGSAATKLGWLAKTTELNGGKIRGIYDRKLAHASLVSRSTIGSLLRMAQRDPEGVRTFLDRRIDTFAEYDAVVPGAMLLDRTLAQLEITSFVASTWGTRHGLAWLLGHMSARGRSSL